ncbi:acetate kinase [Vibrio sp. JCM 19236]|nr:acetate kinase [Vibrio sp. JCM 19236]
MSKLVLVLNCGSSSLKFAIVDAENGDEHLTGLAECLHLPEARIKWKLDGKHEAELGNGAAHDEALSFIVDTILASKPELSQSLAAIGHRVVHGGEKFTESALITDDVLKGIEDCAALAPLHNPAAIVGIKAAQKAFPSLPMSAVFDTAFHQTMPQELTYTLYHTTYTKSTASVATACTVLLTYLSLAKQLSN